MVWFTAHRICGSSKGAWESLKPRLTGHQSRYPYGTLFPVQVEMAVFLASTVWMFTGRRSIVSSVWPASANSTMLVSSVPGNTMIRSASGMSWKPSLLAHQLLRRSKMRCVGVESVSSQGLVVIGCPLAMSRNV